MIKFSHIPGGNTCPAAGAKQRAVVFCKINAAVDNAVVVHLNQIAFPDFLIPGDILSAAGAGDNEDMAAPDFSAIGVLIGFHGIPH